MELIAAVGVLPAFLLLWYAERFERRVREPWPWARYRILVASGLSAIPIAWIELQLAKLATGLTPAHQVLYESVVVAAATEEVVKFACLWLLTRGALRPGSRYGAFIYALHAALGFAAVENVVALVAAPTLEELTATLLLRGYLAVPTHLFAGGVVGYFWARRRFDQAGLRLPAAIGLGIVIHGSYNVMVTAVERLPGEGFEVMLTTYAMAALMIPLTGIVVLYGAALHLRRRDQGELGQAPSLHLDRRQPDPGDTADERRAARAGRRQTDHASGRPSKP